jgi:hypothetical protein
MNQPKPEFHLRRVDTDGMAGPAEIYSLLDLPDQTITSRRGLLGTGVAAATLLAWLGDPRRAGGAADPPRTSRGAPPRGRRTTSVAAHMAAVTALGIAGDGTLLVSASADRTVKLWSLPGGQLVRTLIESKLVYRALAVLSPAKVLAIEPVSEGAKLWELSNAQARSLTTVVDRGARGGPVAMTADGQMIALAAGQSIRLRALPGGQVLHPFDRLEAAASSLALAPDRGALVAGFNDRSVKIWSVPDGKLLAAFNGQGQMAGALAISPDREVLACGSSDHRIRIRSVPRRKLVRTLEGHPAGITALSIAPEGRLLASGDARGVVILWDLETGAPLGYLFDPKVNATDAFAYHVVDPATGRTVTYMLPCGSPIPPGAVCTCNCVPGTYRPVDSTLRTVPRPRRRRYRSPEPEPELDPIPPFDPTPFVNRGMGGFGGRTSCSCNKVCVCIPVCQAHRLLHADPVVRVMAEELLLAMRERESAYMTWAAGRAEPALAERIGQILGAIRAGRQPNPGRWPGFQECVARLDDRDEVVAIMAAQMLDLGHRRPESTAGDRLSGRVEELLQGARENPWYTREEAFGTDRG